MEFNTSFANWYRNFPEWWRQDAFLDALGHYIEDLKTYYIYILLTSRLEQPVQVWLDAQREEEDFNVTTEIKEVPQTLIAPAPLYQALGWFEAELTINKYVHNPTFMINDKDGIQIPQSVKQKTIKFDINKQKAYIDDEEVDFIEIGEGITYFKTSQYKDINELTENDPIHNECVRLTFTSETISNNIGNLTINIEKPVFYVEQNIKLSTIALLPLKEIKLFVYYDTPHNPQKQGWQYVWKKNYKTEDLVTYDRLTKHYYSKIFYVELAFAGFDYSLSFGFPQSEEPENETDAFHINLNLDKWGKIFGLPRRYYKENIPLQEYPNTLPPYYPYPIEQDFWYERRLLNEYVWNSEAIDSTFLTDTNGENVIYLHAIDPYVEDLVVEAGSKLPTDIGIDNILRDIKPKHVLQQSTSSINKQRGFRNLEEVLVEDGVASLSLDNKINTAITRETYKSYLVDFMFDLSDLPTDINITGFEINIDTESDNNSVSKFTDGRTAILLNNMVDEDVITNIFRPHPKLFGSNMQDEKCVFCLDENDFNGLKEYARTWSKVCPKCGEDELEFTNAIADTPDSTGDVHCKNCGAHYCGYCGHYIGTAGLKTKSQQLTDYKLKKGLYASYYHQFEDSYIIQQDNLVTTFGSPYDTFGLDNIISNGKDNIDLRDYLVDNGMHFLLGITNNDPRQDCTINIYDVNMTVYYDNKEPSLRLATKLKYNKDKSANLEITLTNTGSVNLTDNIHIITSSRLSIDGENKPKIIKTGNLPVGNSLTTTVTIDKYEESTPNGLFDILITCGSEQKHVTYKINEDGLIPTKIYTEPAYSVLDTENNKVVDLTAYVTAENSDIINKGKVKFYIDEYLVKEKDTNVTDFDVTQGYVNITGILPKNMAGRYTLEARYSGADEYASSNYYSTVLISRQSTITHMNDIRTKVNENEDIFTANVQTITGAPVNEGKVEFYISYDDESWEFLGHSYIDNNDGNASLIVNNLVKNVTGNFRIKASYTGTIAYGPSRAEATATIVGGDVRLNINAIDPLIVGEYAYIETTITEDNNKNPELLVPVTDGQVTYTILGNEYIIPVDETGTAELKLFITEEFMDRYESESQYIELNALYEDINSYNGYNTTFKSKTLHIDRYDTKLTVNDIIGFQNQTIGILAKVECLNSDYNPITKGEVEINFPNDYQIKAPVNQYGEARIYYNLLNITYEQWDELNKFAFEHEIIRNENSAIDADILNQLYEITPNEQTYYDENGYETTFLLDKRHFIIEEDENNNKILYIEMPSGDNAEVIFLDNGTVYIDIDKSKLLNEFSLLLNNNQYTAQYTSELLFKTSTDEVNININTTNYDIEMLGYQSELEETIKLKAKIIPNIDVTDIYYVRFLLDDDILYDDIIPTDITLNDNNFIKEISIEKEHIINEPAHEYILSIEYYNKIGNDIDLLCKTCNRLNITKIQPRLTASLKPIFEGEDGHLKINLQKSSSTNRNLTGSLFIQLNNDTIDSYNNTENLTTYETDIHLPNHLNGTDILKIIYSGDEYTEGKETSINLIPEQEEVNISVYQSNNPHQGPNVAMNNNCLLNLEVTPKDSEINKTINEGTLTLGYYDNDNFIEINRNNINEYGLATFEFNINNSKFNYGENQLIARYNNSIHYIDEEVIITINVIQGLDYIYLAPKQKGIDSENCGDDINGDGSFDKPFETISHALTCLNDNGTIKLKDGIYEINDINFKQNVHIVGTNEVFIKNEQSHNITFTCNQGHEVLFKNVNFINQNNTTYYFVTGSDIANLRYGAMTFIYCILDDCCHIQNIGGTLTIHRSSVLANMNLISGENHLDDNWWGSNSPDLKNQLDNYVTASLTTSSNKPTTVGDDIDIYITLSNKGNDSLYPQRKVSLNIPYGDLSIYTSTLVNNKLETHLSNITNSCTLKAYIDDEVLELPIEEYIKNIELKVQNISIPKSETETIKVYAINSNNKKINYGTVKLYNDNILIDTSSVNDGLATFTITMNGQYESPLTAIFYDENNNYWTETKFTINEIPTNDENNTYLYVDCNTKTNQKGTFTEPYKTINQAIINSSVTKHTHIYIKPGTYNENILKINNKEITLHAYQDNVVLNGGTRILENNNGNVTINNIRFTNYDNDTPINSLILNVGTLNIDQCTFESNDSETIFYNEDNLTITNSAIVNNSGYAVINEGDCEIDKVWWGQDEPNFGQLIQNVRTDEWINMDFRTNISPINVDTTPLLSATLDSTFDGVNHKYEQIHNLPSRLAKFNIDILDFSKIDEYGSLTPLLDYTNLQNIANSLYNTIADPNILNTEITINNEDYYYNSTKYIFSCDVTNAYGEKVEHGTVTLYIDNEKITSQNITSDNQFYYEIINDNNSYQIGQHTIKYIYDDTEYKSCEKEQKIDIKLNKITLSNVIIEASIDTLFISATARDVNNLLINNKKIQFFIDNEEISGTYYINDNDEDDINISYTITKLPRKYTAGNYTLTIYSPATNEFEELNFSQNFTIPLSDTNIYYNGEVRDKIYLTEDNDKDLIFNISLINGLNVDSGSYSVYIDDELITNQSTDDGVIDLDYNLFKEENQYIITILYNTDGLHYNSCYKKIIVGVGFYEVKIVHNTIKIPFNSYYSFKPLIYTLDDEEINDGQIKIEKINYGNHIEPITNGFINYYHNSSYQYHFTDAEGHYQIKITYRNPSKYLETIKIIDAEIVPREIVFSNISKLSALSGQKLTYDFDLKVVKTESENDFNVHKGLIIARINNEQISTDTVNNVSGGKGHINLNIPTLEIGTYNLELEYIDNDCYYMKHKNNINIEILPNHVSIIKQDANQCYPEETTFNFKLLDEYNNNVNFGKVEFYQNGSFLESSQINSNEYVSCTIKPTVPQILNLTAYYYDESLIYDDMQNQWDIEVIKIPIDDLDHLPIVNGLAGEKLHYECDITSPSHTLINDAYFSLYIDNELIKKSKIHNGHVSFDYELPHVSNNEYNAYCTITDSLIFEDYQSEIFKTNIEKIPLPIEIDNIELYMDEKITISPTFNKTSGIFFIYINDNFIGLESIENDDKFTVTYDMPENINPLNTVTIKFAGNNKYNESIKQVDLNVLSRDIAFSLTDITSLYSEDIYLHCVTDLPAGKNIDFYLDDNFITNGTTDEDGYAYAIWENDLIKGEYELKAKFNGTPLYNSNEDTSTLTINAMTISDIELNTNLYIGSTFNPNPIITTTAGQHPTDIGIISYQIEGSAYTEAPFILNENLTDNQLNIKFTPYDDNKYEAFSTTKTINWLKNKFIVECNINNIQTQEYTLTIKDINNEPISSIFSPNLTGKIKIDNEEFIFDNDELTLSTLISIGRHDVIFENDNPSWNEWSEPSTIIINTINEVYVEQGNLGNNLGTQNDPFTSLETALDYVSPDGIINIINTCDEDVIINKNVTIKNGNLTGNITNNNYLKLENIQINNLINNSSLISNNCEFNTIKSNNYSNIQNSTINEGIILGRDTSQSVINNCIFNSCDIAIKSLLANNIDIENCDFINNNNAIYINGTAHIFNNNFADNEIDIILSNGELNIDHNTFKNPQTIIECRDGGSHFYENYFGENYTSQNDIKEKMICDGEINIENWYNISIKNIEDNNLIKVYTTLYDGDSYLDISDFSLEIECDGEVKQTPVTVNKDSIIKFGNYEVENEH